MSWTLEYVPEKRLVLVLASGEITDEDGRAQIAGTVTLLNEHKANLALVDYSDVVTNASLPGLYRLPDYATELGAPWNLRVAVLVPKTRLRIEMFRFFALVSRNAGYDVHLFDDRESAEAWLEQPATVRNGTPQFAST
jgi:hypothetical protein